MNTHDTLTSIAIREFHCDPDKLVPGTTIKELGIDSLGLMEFIFRIEEVYNIRIDNDQADKLHTLEDMVRLVDSLSTPAGA